MACSISVILPSCVRACVRASVRRLAASKCCALHSRAHDACCKEGYGFTVLYIRSLSSRAKRTPRSTAHGCSPAKAKARRHTPSTPPRSLTAAVMRMGRSPLRPQLRMGRGREREATTDGGSGDGEGGRSCEKRSSLYGEVSGWKVESSGDHCASIHTSASVGTERKPCACVAGRC